MTTGLCGCGCGEHAPIATRNDARRGWVKGDPKRFVAHHHTRLMEAGYDVVDRGHSTPCWIWRGATGGGGYARSGGRYVHRTSYERHRGPIPTGLTIDHLCRVRNCVNPDHLEPVTMVENLARGNGVPARNARKTHCVHGHELVGANLGVRANGWRYCRACRREARRAS